MSRLFALLSAISFVLALLLLAYLTFALIANRAMYPTASLREGLSLAFTSETPLAGIPFMAWHLLLITMVLPLTWLAVTLGRRRQESLGFPVIEDRSRSTPEPPRSVLSPPAQSAPQSLGMKPGA